MRLFHPEGPSLYELAVQAFSSMEDGYDLLAGRFDHTPFRTPDAMLKRAAEVIGPPGCIADALDVCCGTGAAMLHLRSRCRDRIVGVDLSTGMLAEARRRLRGAPGSATVDLVRADALDLPFTEAFDVATCFGALGHIAVDDEPAFVRSVARTLRPGGRFVFVTSDPPPLLSLRALPARAFNVAMRVRNALWRPPFVMYYFTFLLPRARRLLEDNGFDVDVRTTLFPPPYERFVLVVAHKRG